MNRKIAWLVSAAALGMALLVLASPAAAARWVPLGPPDGATVLSLAYDPAHPTTVYAGTAGGGVVKSIDGGRTWAYSSLGLDESIVTALAVDRQDPRVVYAGTPGGLFRSMNGGASWSAAAETPAVDGIAVDPQRVGNLYIGTANGMYRSYDGGRHWALMARNLVPFERRFWVPSLVVAPSRPSVLYSAYFGYRSGAFRSLDGGKTWTRILRAGIKSVAVDPVNAAIVYAADGSKVWRSTDFGQTWSSSQPIAGELYVAPNRTVCVTSGYWSEDQGLHWEPIPGLPDRGFGTMAFHPNDFSKLLIGTSGGGVFRSDNGGMTWGSSSTGLVNFTAFAVAAVPNPRALLAGGFSGIYRTTDGGATWKRVLRDVPIRSLAVDPSDPATLYAGVLKAQPAEDTNRLVFKSTDGGITWNPAAVGITKGPIMSLAVDPADSRTVYAGAWDYWDDNQGNLFRSKDGGATWEVVPGLAGVSGIAFDPSDPKVIYVTQRRGLFHSRNGGKTWTQRMVGEVPPLRARMTRGVAISPVNPDRLVVNDFRAIFLSFDTGKTWVKSHGCAPVCWDVTFDPLNADSLYAGSTHGVLRTLDGGDTWPYFSKGLPGVEVYNLTFDPAEPTKLYAGTGSAGLFMVDLAH
jgi:photosystem II stability/assembly factor-like uncharacterized protein